MYRPEDYHYELPNELIAQVPLADRDQSRLMHLDRTSGQIEHRVFTDVPQYLQAGDVVVLNDTKVIPGRLYGRKETGGKVEVLLLDFAQGIRKKRFACLVKASKRPAPGSRLIFDEGLTATVEAVEDRVCHLRFHSTQPLDQVLEAIGHVPLPPYIQRGDTREDRHTYQTIYATHEGAIAAPTAGLHFSRPLMQRLEGQGVRFVRLTLHVGYGTFMPIRTADIRRHRMHAEYFELSATTVDTIQQARSRGHRVVAVGTTCVRTLEFCARGGTLTHQRGLCDLFIYPGYRFNVVDAMITNFHLPQSTLMMLISAFAGRENVFKAYEQAVRKRYRFFSYGDAMLIS